MRAQPVQAFVLGDGPNALSVARDLGRHGVPVHVFGKTASCVSSGSRYVLSRTIVDANEPQRFVAALKSAVSPPDSRPVLLITSDYFLQLVSTTRIQLEAFCQFELPTRQAVDTVLDKARFNDFCTAHELPVPRSWAPTSVEDCRAVAAAAVFPVVIKPNVAHDAESQGFSNNGEFAKMILAKDASELDHYFGKLRKLGALMVIQEYIVGPDDEHYSYMSCRTRESEEIVGVGVRKLRVTPIHAGVAAFAEVVDDDDLARISRLILQKLDYVGVSSVCFKRDVRSGQLFCHEINGRFPLAQSATRLCGINLPLMAYQDVLGTYTVQKARSPTGGKWVSLDGDIEAFRQYRRAGEIKLAAWLWSLRKVRVCIEFASDDWRPFFGWSNGMARRAAQKARRAPAT